MADCSGNTPFFSIVIPAYNREDVIGDTLASCIAQTWSDYEVIVVDDGSSDGTPGVVADYARRHPEIRLLTQSNSGPAAARNLGVREARGKYIAFLDSDDRFLPEKLEVFARHIEETGAGLLYGPVLSERGNGAIWLRPESGLGEGESIFDYLFLRRGVVLPSTVLVERDAALRFPFLESLWFGDNDQFAADMWRAGVCFHFVEQPLTRYADQEDPSRLSRLPLFDHASPRHRAFFDWVESQRSFMSKQAYLAYRARFLSRAIAKDSPMRGAGEILVAWRQGALTGSACLRQFAQTFTPDLYRMIADLVARRRGDRLSGSPGR